jgi:Mg2+ and Co2+ transporter CorA
MPELQWRYGYILFWGLVLVICSSVAFFFRRSGFW